MTASATIHVEPEPEPELPVLLELLRTQLQAIADEAGDTVERTAISPIVVESQDYGSVILDSAGSLVAGGGQALLHRVGATRAVRATIERYGDTIIDGDVYLSNDPHNGGGMHPSDVMVQRPMFVDGVLVGWGVLSAHLIDMGGMAVGSWAPHATECFQEALRLPPVRLVKAGAEVSDVWDIFRTNVRFSEVVEMDLRSLMAGTYVAQRKLAELVRSMGVRTYQSRLTALVESTAAEMLRRIRLLEPGSYSSTGWTEWGDEFIATPCTLTVSLDGLVFDFEGAPEQIPFFINSKPYIITTLFMPLLASLLAPDLPYNEGLLRGITLRCPVGTVVNCVPPAPANCGHMHLGQTAAETMSHCLRMAVWASPRSAGRARIGGYDAQSAHAPNSYWGIGAGGDMESWMMMDGLMIGQSASPGRDGVDFTVRPIDLPSRPSSQPTPLDAELYESWYPMLIHERRLLPGSYGAGRWRCGGSLGYRFEPWKTDELGAQMLGYRGRIPLPGVAGGRPGRAARFVIRRAEGTAAFPAMNESNVTIRRGDTFELSCCSGGGWGDPLDREPENVAEDVADGRLDTADARHVYGVILHGSSCDASATQELRAELRRARLARGQPPRAPLAPGAVDPLGDARLAEPLYVGVVQQGPVAYAEASGSPLAVAPAHWTDGCPQLVESDAESPIVLRTYLDPQTGAALHTDVTPPGVERSFTTMPMRWLRESPDG
jgi:N-methylhydantoinase B